MRVDALLRFLLLAILAMALTSVAAGEPPKSADPPVSWLSQDEIGPKPTEQFYLVEAGEFQYFVFVRGFLGYGNASADREGQARVAIYDKSGALQVFYSAPMRSQTLVWRIEAEASVPWGPHAEAWTPDSIRIDWEVQGDGEAAVEIHDGFSKPEKGTVTFVQDVRHAVRIALSKGAVPVATLLGKASSP